MSNSAESFAEESDCPVGWRQQSDALCCLVLASQKV